MKLLDRTFLATSIIGLVAGLASLASAATPAPGPSAASACTGPDLLFALAHAGGSGEVAADRTPGTLVLRDARRMEPLVSLGCDTLEVTASELERPAQGEQAATRVVRDAEGRRLYTVTVTARGARVVVFEAGVVAREALHFIAFDNDDFHVTDGAGRLVQSRHTAPDGTLVERQGATYGCGCERTTFPDGRTSERALR